ncbi:unnamed protein product [Arctia plantaginis]|uniref:Uncharacterized protein n=1 Tax=Arctia plantaginis TaxID=874455 RepID=A0A8S1BNP8_ARCPL|nr:unnamed protein product [Arctia plantaginis]
MFGKRIDEGWRVIKPQTRGWGKDSYPRGKTVRGPKPGVLIPTMAVQNRTLRKRHFWGAFAKNFGQSGGEDSSPGKRMNFGELQKTQHLTGGKGKTPESGES